MYRPELYKDVSVEAIADALREENFDPQRIVEPAGFTRPPHTHPYDTVVAVIEGSMQITLGDETHDCTPGDRVDIQAGTVHAAVAGENGVVYWWSPGY